MPCLRPVVFSHALLLAILVGLCNADLYHRANVCTFSCPLTDNIYAPLGWGSGLSNNTLRCNYPDVFRCIYDALSGALIRDYDVGFCYTLATCTSLSCDSYQCPSSDRDTFILGPGTQRIGPTLVCVFPILAQTNITSAFCNYSMSTGALVYDYDAGRCPSNAISQACTPMPTATSTVFSTPTAAIAKAKTTTIVVGTTLGVVAIAISCLTALLLYARRKRKIINDNNTAVMGISPTSPTFLRDPVVYPDQRVISPYQANSSYRIPSASPTEGTYPHLPEI